MKKTLVALAIVCMACFLWWLLKPRLVTLREEVASEVERENLQQPSAELSPVINEDKLASLSAPQEAESQPEEDGQEGEFRLRHRLLRGSVVVTDHLGNEHTDESGTLQLLLVHGETPSPGRNNVITIRVRNGAWSAQVSEGSSLAVKYIELRAREAVWEGPQLISVPESGFLGLRARWPNIVTLRVRADTGEDLEEVSLVTAKGRMIEGLQHPGEQIELVTTGNSPLELDAGQLSLRLQTYSLFARSPGFAWGQIRIDFSAGGDRLLELQRGGELNLYLQAQAQDPGTTIRLRETERSRPLVELPAAGRDRILINSIAAGDYLISAELGAWYEKPRVLASARATISPGVRSELTLNLETVTARAKVSLEGTLFVPEEWQQEKVLILPAFPALTLNLLDTPVGGSEKRTHIWSYQMTRDPIDGNLLYWSAEVQPGRYELRVLGLYYSISLEVGDSGRRDVRIDVPPPARVRVHTVDAKSGGVAEIERLNWTCARPQWVRGGAMASVTRDPELDYFEFRVPQGKIEIGGSGQGYLRGTQVLHVGAGLTEAILKLDKGCGLSIRVQDGDRPVPWDRNWRVRLTAVEGGGQTRGSTTSSEGVRHYVSEPGRYRLTFPKIAGFRPVPDREFQIQEGQVIDHVVRLEREY